MPQFSVPPPLKGVNRVVPREGQPPDTCWDAVNVLPYDRFGRNRISQRHGLSKFSSTQLATSKVQAMLSVPGLTYSASTGSTVLLPVSTFSHLPGNAGFTQSTNNLIYSSSYAPSLTSDIAVVSSTILTSIYGTTLQFNLIYTGNSTVNAATDFYVALSNGSTTTTNILGTNDPVDVLFQYNPQNPTNQIHVEINTNNGAGFSTFANDSTGTFTLGQVIPCSITVSNTGAVSCAFGALVPPTLNITSTANTASTMSFLGETASDTKQSVTALNFVTTSTVATGQVGYQTMLVAVAGGNVWAGTAAGGAMTQIPYASSTLLPSTARISSSAYVSMAYANGIVFIADGSSTLWSVNVTSTTIGIIPASTVSSTSPVASPGNITGTVPPNCNLCCVWRGRVVLAGDSGNSNVWYMSRPPGQYFNTVTSTQVFINAGVDWDFSQTDESAAIYGKTAGVNNIFEPITALIPFSNDYLKLGCAHSLWMFQGDPTTGNIVNVSQNIGVVGKDAWTIDSAGTLYFVASGGLYSCRPAWEFYRPPEPVTPFSVHQNFTQLDPGVARTTLVFDPDAQYLHAFMTAPPISGTAGQHLTMDARTVGQGAPAFWPQTFPSTMGPSASCLFFADGNPNNRTVLIGGNDGYIRQWTTSALDDDGSTIGAGITLGPFALAGPGNAATVQGVTIDLGETPTGISSTNFAAVFKLAAGPDAYSVTEFLPSGVSPKPTAVYTTTLDRRQKTLRQRMRGGWFSINLASFTDNSLFSFESAVIDFIPSGLNRERRQ